MKKILTYAALTLAVAISASPVMAESVKTTTTRTIITNKPIAGATAVDFSVFDTNQDGVYSKEEVGERLFKSFDKDGNELVDKNEWKLKTVITIIPMQRQTIKSVEYNNDGIAHETVHTYEEFNAATGLSKFDLNKNGLSAQEFIGKDFYKVDTNKDNFIDIDEWRSAYIESLPKVPMHNRPSNYNE